MIRLADVTSVASYDPTGATPEQIREDLRVALGWASAIGDGLGPAPRPKDDVRKALRAAVEAAVSTGAIKTLRVSAMSPAAVDLVREVVGALNLPPKLLESQVVAEPAPPPRLLGIREGERGVGVVHTLELGLTSEQVAYTHGFGWRPLRLTEARIAQLDALAPAPWARLNESATPRARIESLASRLVALAPTNREARALAAIVSPVDVVTRITIAREGETGCVSWKTATPATQFDANPLREARPSWRVVEIEDGDASGSRDFRQILALGTRGPVVREAASDRFDRAIRRESFRWTAGPQEDLNRRFRIAGGELAGDWQLSAIEVDGAPVWSFHRAPGSVAT